jgi:hypothetical protein
MRIVDKLNTTTDAFDRMWHVINERRTGTKVVKVSVEDLMGLLKDHSVLSSNTQERD